MAEPTGFEPAMHWPEDIAPALGGHHAAPPGQLVDVESFQIRDLPREERRPKLTADQARTMRAKIAIGHGRHPFGGPLRKPAGETCGSCGHCEAVRYNRTFYKCGLTRAQWTKGPGSDLRRKWPACERWTPKPTHQNAHSKAPSGLEGD